ncbi:histidine acid phosphatase superfamily protein [Emydomyces testavorans]|uniref:Histidine acid phosphatase superfamily protein n=1 Tax=Emydomyces testavorans TaxID=2070801 RepID=A0AAF0DA05_9EURO|nr:histidine acid phosphatase superfamily protein [Emydomyces testavorans]
MPVANSLPSSQLGELTDKGRQSTLALGRRLRHLYVDQLGYMPQIISNADHMYLRATPIPRALESLQQAFWGMYPASARTSEFVPPTIVQRTPAEETLYPNEGNCHRFRQLARLFAQRAADRCIFALKRFPCPISMLGNGSEQMDYLNSLWSRWMPTSSPRVAVDSRPRLSGILDTINSTMAHGPQTRLPSEFYDSKGHEVADRIAMDEWFSGYRESREYRKLGVGALMGDIVDRMVASSVGGGWWPTTGSKRDIGPPVKFAISGCHDTTIAAILTSLGAFDNERWPPYTANIAIELFKDVGGSGRHPQKATSAGTILEELSNPLPENNNNNNNNNKTDNKPSSFLSFLRRSATLSNATKSHPADVARTPVSKLPPLHKHYVRIRYNDRPVIIPGCAAKPANHLPGEPSFCTLEAFKQIVDKYTPKNWREECSWNTDKGMFVEGEERAGY